MTDKIEVTQADWETAEEAVSGANIVSHDGYYEIDIDAVSTVIARHRRLSIAPYVEALRKLRDGYASQAKFADPEPAAYFREFVRRIDALLHGDEGHRAWLVAAAEAFNRGAPVPPPTPTTPPASPDFNAGLEAAVNNIGDEQLRYIAESKDIGICRQRILAALRTEPPAQEEE